MSLFSKIKVMAFAMSVFFLSLQTFSNAQDAIIKHKGCGISNTEGGTVTGNTIICEGAPRGKSSSDYLSLCLGVGSSGDEAACHGVVQNIAETVELCNSKVKQITDPTKKFEFVRTLCGNYITGSRATQDSILDFRNNCLSGQNSFGKKCKKARERLQKSAPPFLATELKIQNF